MATSTIDQEEIRRFAALADSWWDPAGEFAPLHRLNPARLSYLRGRFLIHFGRPPDAVAPFDGLTLLDIGCGGGLISEPMARLGFAVTAIDAGAETVAAARAHAAATGLAIDYHETAAETLAATDAKFDVVLALEVVEHVADVSAFLGAAAALVRPGGALVLATVNRTPKSFLFAIVGAEYLLGWIPRGTHRWNRFCRPSELAAELRPRGLGVTDVAGLTWQPWRDGWQLTQDHDVNYFLFAGKQAD